MAAVALRDRVERIMRAGDRTEDERVHEAVDQIAEEVDRVSRRLAIIDPEWELLTRHHDDEGAAAA